MADASDASGASPGHRFHIRSSPDNTSVQAGLTVLVLIATFSFLVGKLETLSCETKEALMKRAWARHALGLASLFAVMVVFTRTSPVMSPPCLIACATVIYALFLLVCRCDVRFQVIIVVGLFAVIYLEAQRFWLVNGPDAEDVKGEVQAREAQAVRRIFRIEAWIEVAVGVAALIGCLVYLGQHAREYDGDRWSWTNYWMGVAACQGNGTPCDKAECTIAGDVYDGCRRLVGLPCRSRSLGTKGKMSNKRARPS
jgi:hypothetical protein